MKEYREDPSERISLRRFVAMLAVAWTLIMVAMAMFDIRVEENKMLEEARTHAREVIILLRTYHFPDNIRELESMIFDILSGHHATMLPLEPFKNYISGTVSSVPLESPSKGQGRTNRVPLTLGQEFPTLGEATQFLIAQARERADGNLGIAAHLLGISRQALSKRLKRASES